MRLSLLLSAAISLAAMSLVPTKSVLAASFGEQEINQNQFAVIAAPYRHGYNLVVVEQIPGQKKCWEEIGKFPTVVKPLFLEFDFTNACKRSSDSNNYSIRFNGQDYGMDYLVNIVKQNGELHLVGVPRDQTKPQLHLGRTHGLSSGSLKIVLDPQWRLTKRLYGENATDHLYLSNSSPESTQLISHALEAATTVPQDPKPNHPTASTASPEIQPVNSAYQPPMPNNYSQPVYQQPVYPVQPMAPQPVYQQPVYSVQPMAPQPVYQQPVYSVQPMAPQPVYQQPVYSGQPVYGGNK